jgi:hypothetical protein
VALDNDDVAELLDRPSPAVLTTYRADGTAVASPVWYRRTDDSLEVVIADSDVKLRHLARRPESALLIFEATIPFRAVRVEGTPILDHVGGTEARRSIARRYLGIDRGDAFTASRGSATIVRFPRSGARTWDLSGILPT